MAILVLGNGFDLAHNLPTSYEDYLMFVEALKGYDLDGDSPIKGCVEEFKTGNSENLKEASKLLNKRNDLLNFFLKAYKERVKNGKNGWIDFETEISQIVQCFEKIRECEKEAVEKGANRFTIAKRFAERIAPFCCKNYECNEANLIRKFNVGFFDTIEFDLLENLNDLTRLLEIYLVECIEKMEISLKIQEIKELKNITHILSFNYTDTYLREYNKDVEYCFIHGRATPESSVKRCNLVLGIDEYLENERRDNDNQFVWFKKFYQRIYKETSSTYIDWLEDHTMMNERYKKSTPTMIDIYYYGHSLDVTDKDVLNQLFLHKNSINHIFYHNKETMAQQISNLVKIIGEKNLITMTRGSNRTIEFIPVKDSRSETS